MADINEIKLWEWCKTHGDYAGYLMRYPNGSYSAEAKALMNGGKTSTTYQASISEDSELEYLSWQMQKKEESDLSEAEAFRNCRVLADFEAFVRKYPNGEFTEKAWVVIEKLRPVKKPNQKSEPVQPKPVVEPVRPKQPVWDSSREELNFKKCKTITDFEKYIVKYPHGRFWGQAKAKIEKLKAEQEAWKKNRRDEDDLKECNTIEDFQRFIETHPGSNSLKAAKNNIGALKVEPKQLTVLLICNVLSIAALIVGLCINKVHFIGLVLLILGLVEMIAYFVVPEEKRLFHKGQTYLILSGLISIIGGVVFLLI